VVNGLTLRWRSTGPPSPPGFPEPPTITALTVVLTWINVRGIKLSSWVVNWADDRQAVAAWNLHSWRHLVHSAIAFRQHAGGVARAVFGRGDPPDFLRTAGTR
jgi:hypothetical protein